MKRPGRQIAIRTRTDLPDPGEGRLPNILERMAQSAANTLSEKLGHNFLAGQPETRPIQFRQFRPGKTVICQGRLKNMNCGLTFALERGLGQMLADLGMGGQPDFYTGEIGPAGKSVLKEITLWLAGALGESWDYYSANEFFETENVFIPPDGQLPFESNEQMLECALPLELARTEHSGRIMVIFPWRELAGHARMLSGAPMPPITFGQHMPQQSTSKTGRTSRKSILNWFFPKVPFAGLLKLPDPAIARILSAEAPQLQAAVLTFLPRARANSILESMTDQDYIHSLCKNTTIINSTLLNQVEQVLDERAHTLDMAVHTTPQHW